MGKKFITKNGIVYDTYSGSIVKEFGNNEEDNKSYASVAMCGHCGNGYYIPILFAHQAVSKNDIPQLVKNTSRVKRDFKYHLLSIEEIDYLEYLLIEAINDSDNYLIPQKEEFARNDIEERRVMLPDLVKLISEGDKKEIQKRYEINNIPAVKTADMYPSYMVLQRRFAPQRKYSEKQHKDFYSFPQKVKIHDFLEDYFTAKVFELFIIKRSKTKIAIMAMYYQLYGENNKLGVHYENGKLYFKNSHNEDRVYVLEEVYKNHIENSIKKHNLKQQKETVYDYIDNKLSNQITRPSAVERFNSRLQKTRQLAKPAQPGEE